MASKLKMLALSFAATCGLMLNFAAPLALAQSNVVNNDSTPTGALNCGAGGDLTGQGCAATSGADDKVKKTIKLAIQLFQIVVGLISVFYLISAGLKYITSGGDSTGVAAAKNQILFAVVGLVVVALAQVIVGFVLNRVNSATQL